MNARAFPSAKDLERGLLGALSMDAGLIADVSTVLRASHFYDPAHAELYTSLLALSQRGTAYDQTLLVELLPQVGFDLQSVGGVAGFLQYGDEAAVPVALRQYAVEIVQLAIRREALRELDVLKGAMYEPHVSPEQQLDGALASLVALRNTNTSRTSTSLGDAMLEVEEELAELKANDGQSRGIPTGFDNIDESFCNFPGFWPGELIIICGHTSHGKTTFALNMVLKAITGRAKNGRVTRRPVPVAFFSAEMPASALARRIVSISAGIDATMQRNGQLCDNEEGRWADECAKLQSCPLEILEGGVSIEEVAAHTRIIDQRFRRQGYSDGLGLVVVDYLQRLKPTDARLSREEQVAHMSWSAKSLAIEMDIPVICLAQPNREAFRSNNTRPKLHHLRDSGRIEQDADTVMAVYWPYKDADAQTRDDDPSVEKSKYEVEVLKCRNGGLGGGNLHFEPRFTRLRDWLDTTKGDYHG